jgi:hypothetical protein
MRVLAAAALLGLVACGTDTGDSGAVDTGVGSLRSMGMGVDAWVRVRGLEWRRQGPNVAMRFRTDEDVTTRVCDDAGQCVPSGLGRRHEVLMSTSSSTLTIEVEARDGALAVFGPFAVSEGRQQVR